MNTGKIQLHETLFGQLQHVAQADAVPSGTEIYGVSCPEANLAAKSWILPVLRGSGGHLVDPASIKSEAAAIEGRFQRP